jgi:hypothetical protein
MGTAFGFRWRRAARTRTGDAAQGRTCTGDQKKKTNEQDNVSYPLPPGGLYRPEWVAVVVFVMYFVLSGSFVVLSYQFSTSKTAWGLFFCSCLLMLEFISSRDHASGIPYRQKENNYVEDREATLTARSNGKFHNFPKIKNQKRATKSCGLVYVQCDL